MARPNKRTREEVIAAIKGSGGIKMTIARNLRVSRATLYVYLRKWAGAREALAAEEEEMLDISESVVATNIILAYNIQRDKGVDEDGNEGPGNIVNPSDAKWYLTMKGRERGYAKTERAEITGAEGEPIKIVRIGGINPDDDI